MDIAKKSLVDFIKRLSDRGSGAARFPFPIRLVHSDLGKRELDGGGDGGDVRLDCWSSQTTRWQSGRGIPEELGKFDLASMQFALHYMFQSRGQVCDLHNHVPRWSD